jgi:hypothetical protein
MIRALYSNIIFFFFLFCFKESTDVCTAVVSIREPFSKKRDGIFIELSSTLRLNRETAALRICNITEGALSQEDKIDAIDVRPPGGRTR